MKVKVYGYIPDKFTGYVLEHSVDLYRGYRFRSYFASTDVRDLEFPFNPVRVKRGRRKQRRYELGKPSIHIAPTETRCHRETIPWSTNRCDRRYWLTRDQVPVFTASSSKLLSDSTLSSVFLTIRLILQRYKALAQYCLDRMHTQIMKDLSIFGPRTFWRFLWGVHHALLFTTVSCTYGISRYIHIQYEKTKRMGLELFWVPQKLHGKCSAEAQECPDPKGTADGRSSGLSNTVSDTVSIPSRYNDAVVAIGEGNSVGAFRLQLGSCAKCWDI